MRGEISVTFLIDSAVIAALVPAGLRLVTLQQMASQDTVIARFLASQPQVKSAVTTSLAFVALDSLQVDDQRAMPAVGAFWWISVTAAQSVDERARGDDQVEAAFWSPDNSFVRQLRPDWPQLQYAPVTVERSDDGEWYLVLMLADAVIRGRCRPSGDRRPDSYPLPAYTTVWAAGRLPVAFATYTYHGHYNQGCNADWNSEGSHLLAVTLKNSPWKQTRIHDAWHARAGLYRR